ncbi:unnamed protein product [Scytosiphon promiscuus]
MLNCRMRATCAAFAGSFGGQLGAATPSASAARSVGNIRARPWQKLFCSASNEPHQQHAQEQLQQERNGSPQPHQHQHHQQPQYQQYQQYQQQPSQLNNRGAAKLEPAALLALEESDPLHHSNPDIQLLLDRYTRLCDGEVTTAASPVFGKADRRSPSRAVFSNTNVDLSRVEVVGFDYDYTLATYKPTLQAVLIYDLAKKHLIERLKYPPSLAKMSYDPDFAIMGLTVDMDKGLLFKLSYINRISMPVYRGRTPLNMAEIEAEYGSYPVMVSPEYRKKQLKPLNDRFCLAEACLVADVVQHLQDAAGTKGFHPRAVVEDVLAAVTHVHVSGMMHEAVLADIGRYIQPSYRLEHMLKTLKGAGKKLFISSNSPWKFVNAGMEHMLGPNWTELFEFIGVSASKPLFYTGQRPFRLVSKRDGRIKWSEVTHLSTGGVFTHGSIAELRRLKAGWEGPSVLYFGDSLWADLVEARKLHGWTTGAIIYDVELELEKMMSPRYHQLSRMAQALDVLLPLVQDVAEMHGSRGDMGAMPTIGVVPEMRDEDHALLDRLEKRKALVKRSISDMTSRSFGSIFRTSDEPTLFAFSLWRHVDLYTASVCNIVNFGVTHRFYPTKTLSVAHEPRVDHGEIHRAIVLGSDDGANRKTAQ